MRQKGRSSSRGLSYDVWHLGHGTGGVGKVGREARGALTRKDTIKGFGGGFELGFLSPQSFHPCVAFWCLSQAAAAAGAL